MTQEERQTELDKLKKALTREQKDKIDLTILNLDSCSRCLFGQIFGSTSIGSAIEFKKTIGMKMCGNTNSHCQLEHAWALESGRGCTEQGIAEIKYIIE